MRLLPYHGIQNPLNPPLRKGEARKRISSPPLYERGVRGVFEAEGSVLNATF